MKAKRKAAADIFMEQNIAQFDDEIDEMEEMEEMKYAYDALEPFDDIDLDADLPVQAAQPLEFESRDLPDPTQLPARPRRKKLWAKTPLPSSGFKTSEELQLEKEPIQVRETGVWLWRRIIVPPNAYVVHTRAGHVEPVTIGLGVSFRYNPRTDAYLVVPAAIQTIGVVANCISQEKQGINILAYVQWQMDDFSVAYRKLDFSDRRDPLGIVNAQLREQAEAAIKDKIATMSVEEVLTDKEPIIEELTTRLKAVAEGRKQGDGAINEGLGIKIVTVQIKEALVSSQRLWEDLQAPFRYEKEKAARISYLVMQDDIRQKELDTRRSSEISQAETEVAIERIKQSKETEAVEIRLAEEETRLSKEQEATRTKIQLEEQTTLARQESQQRVKGQSAQIEQQTQLERMRREQEAALERARLDAEASVRQKALQVEQALKEIAEETNLAQAKLEADQEQIEQSILLKKQEAQLHLLIQEHKDERENQALQAKLTRQRQETTVQLELEEAANRVKMALAEKEMEIARLQQEIRNLRNKRDLASRLIEQLPEVAAQMPQIHELKVLQSSPDGGAFDSLSLFLSKVLALADSLGIPLVTDKE